MPSTLLELRSAWAQSLALLNPVEESKVALLLQLCSQRSTGDRDSSSANPTTIRDAAANILPLIGFVDKSGGQRVDLVMPDVVRQLPLLATDWAVPVADPDTLERLLEEAFTVLRRVLQNLDVELQWREHLSAGIRELLSRLLRTVLRIPDGAGSPGGATPPPPPAAAGSPHPMAPLLPASAPAQIILRTLTRSQAFAPGSGLPLLPSDAEAILTWMVENVLPVGGKVPASSPMAPPPGSRAAISAAASTDEKVLLLTAQLARTTTAALYPPPLQLMTATPSEGEVAARAAAAVAAAAADEKRLATERALLSTLLTWSMGLIRSVLMKLLQPAKGVDALSAALLTGKQTPSGPGGAGGGGAAAAAQQQPSAGVIRAAARLAASAMHGLLLRAAAAAEAADAAKGASAPPAAAGSGVLPAPARAQLMEVISMLLDMSEACVSAALGLGPQVLASDKMLDTAAYILEDCSSLIITAAREATTATATATTQGNSSAAATAKPSAASAAASLGVGAVFSRLKAILLAAAALVGQAPTTAVAATTPDSGGWRSSWAWDLTRPLTASYARGGSRIPGWGAQRLCCNVAEALTCGLAASYHAGVPAYAQALLLLPLSLPDGAASPGTARGTGGQGNALGGAAAAVMSPLNEAQVLSLAMGRLFVLLNGEDALARRMVPLLTDVLGQTAGGPGGVSLQASVVQTLAVMAAESAVSDRGVTWAYSQITDVLLRLLVDGRHPDSAAAVLAARTTGPGAGALCIGLLSLAKGLRGAVLAVRRDLRNRLLVQFGELGIRAGGGADRTSGAAAVAEMGRLLPAVAEAVEGLGAVDGVSYSLSAASRYSLGEMAAQQQRAGGGGGAKMDVQLVKALRNLWLYCALFGLCRQTVPSDQLAAAGRIAACTPVLLLGEPASSAADMAEQLKAELGERLRLAGESAAAPARLRASLQATLGIPVGGTPQPPPDANKQAYLITIATAELARAKYAPLRADAESSPIAVTLTYLQAADPLSSDAAWYGAIADKAFDMYLARLKAAAAAATAVSFDETAAAAADAAASGAKNLNGGHDSEADHRRRASSFPSDRGLSYAGLSAVSRTALGGNSLISAALSLPWPGEAGAAAAQPPPPAPAAEGSGGGEAASAAAAAPGAAAAAAAHFSERCLEGLAVTLIRHLGAVGGHEEGVAPQAATVADRLLKRLLAAYSPVYWSYACVEALLSELEGEEGLDHPLSEVAGGGGNNANHQHHSPGTGAVGVASAAASAATPLSGTGGPVWRWLHAWVYAAAMAAPSRTEALIHLFLGQSSIASYTLDESADGADIGGGNGGTLTSSFAAATAASSHRHRAHVAALRRAADLLAVCADARRRAAVGTGAGVAGDATMALCRKLFFAGVIVGVQYTNGGPSAGPAAVADLALAGLEEGLAAARHNGRLLESRYLGAAAFLAREAAEEAAEALSGSAVHAVCYKVLQGLCTAPLRRFTPDMMSLAVFAWTWITTSGPVWLVPLVSRTTAAWATTVDRGLGLFNGKWDPEGATAAAAGGDGAAASAAEGRDNAGGEAAATAAAQAASETELLAALSCHHQWVAFLYEMWSSAADRTDAERRALASVYDRLLHHSLAAPERLSTHPAAAAPLFRMLQLALAYCIHCASRQTQTRPAAPAAAAAAPPPPCPPALALLYHRVLRAGLMWFAHPPGYSARMSQRQAEEQHAAVSEFATLLAAAAPLVAGGAEPVYDKAKHGASGMGAAAWPASRSAITDVVWGSAAKELRPAAVVDLLSTLCRAEVARLRVWARPLSQLSAAITGAGALTLTEAQVKTAWKVSPQLAISIVQRCPAPTSPAAPFNSPHRTLEGLLVAAAADPRVQALPEAAMVLATADAAKANAPYLAALATWAPAGAVHGLELMCGPAQLHGGIKAYALRCLHAASPARVAFFLPQLVQALRTDTDGATARYLLDTAASDDLFAHQLVWALATEERPPPEAFNPEVKRSGWQPPKDTGLWEPAAALKARVLAAMTPESGAFWSAEDKYFDQVTSISGILKKLEPEERRGKIRRELEGFGPSRPDLYVPTNPDCRVIAHIPESGTPMQSAAKVPILVAFKVAQQQPPPLPPLNRTLACIFKVGDDVRQDVLALQVISILRDAFHAAGLDLYLRPYGCIPTGYERGVIEVVPKTKSRAALGELSDRGLHEIFVSHFGAPGTPAFEQARHNFITSEAGYAIASFLLQAKDRHNGNLLIDDAGHLVHIDFGFILEISPGGNMGFESAAFKLSHEMTQLLDPGGMRNSGHFRLFEELCVRGYLAARTVAEPIIATVALMADSGLPCFGYGRPLRNLRKRFHLEMSEAAAAAFMRGAIADAYQKWTTGFYDYIQALQNRIPY